MTKREWKREPYDETGGYDCMTGAIRIGPVVLDGYLYGQAPCEGISAEARAQMESDADLIAASPELLEKAEALLYEVYICLDYMDDEELLTRADALRVVIAKAKGE